MISVSTEGLFRIWNLSAYQLMSVITNVLSHDISWEYNENNSLYQIDKDRVIVGGVNEIYIVNIDKCLIEDIVKIISNNYTIRTVNSFIKLGDNKTILCGCCVGLFCLYNIETKEYKITRKNHKGLINDLLQINNNTFLSCSFDKTIRVWKY